MLTYGVATELLRRGHEVYVFAGYPAREILPDEARFDQYALEGIQVFRFHHSRVPMAEQTVVNELEYNNLLASRYLAQLLRRISPDIVHFFHLSRLGSGLIDAAIQAGLPSFYTPTDFWAVCPTYQMMLKDVTICHGPTRSAEIASNMWPK